MKNGFWALIACLLLLGCGGSGSDSSGYSISLNTEQIHFSMPRDSLATPDPVRVRVSYQGDGVIVGYPPGVTEPHWLRVDTISSSPGLAEFDISVNAFTTRPANVRATTLRFVTGKSDGSIQRYKDVRVEYERTDVLTLMTGDAFSIDGQYGTVPLSQVLTVDTDTLAWSLVVDQDWVVASPAQGVGPTSVQLTVTQMPETPGQYPLQLSLLNNAGDSVTTQNFMVNIDARRFWFDRATWFSGHFGGQSHSSLLLDVVSSGDYATAELTLATDSTWLSAEFEGERVRVGVNSAELVEGLHLGQVSVQPGVGDSVAPLWVSVFKSAEAQPDLGAVNLNFSGSSNDIYELLADPLRPQVYLHRYGGRQIWVYNYYTGTQELLSDEQTPSPQGILELQLSHDAQLLYVVEGTGNEYGFRTRRFDLQTRTWLEPLPASAGRVIAWYQDGVPLWLRAQDGQLLDANTGSAFTRVAPAFQDLVLGSGGGAGIDNGRYVGAMTMGEGVPAPRRYQVWATRIQRNGGLIDISPVAHQDFDDGSPNEPVRSRQGRWVFQTEQLFEFNPQSASIQQRPLLGVGYYDALGLAVGDNGELFTRSYMIYRQFDPEGQLRRTLNLDQGWPRGMSLSADEHFSIQFFNPIYNGDPFRLLFIATD